MSIQSIGNNGAMATSLSPSGDAPKPITKTETTRNPTTADSSLSSEKTNIAANNPQIQKEVSDSIKKLNDFVGGLSNELEFAQDKDTNIEVVKVIDRNTNEIIRQIPSEEVIQIAKSLDRLQGLLVREKV